MVTHIVIFNWHEGVEPNRVAAFAAALDLLARDVASLGSIRHGADLGFRYGNGDYALSGSFADHEHWAAYQAHPQHKAFLADHVAPLVASRVVIQFQDDPDVR